MNQDEYVARMNAVQAALPIEFANYVSYEAWDRGHSAGYSEVVLYAESMAHDLGKVIAEYNKRMGIV